MMVDEQDSGNSPMDVQQFKRMTDDVVHAADTGTGTKRLTILGYTVDNLELCVACAGRGDVVLSVGDERIALTLNQSTVLHNLLNTFLNENAE